MASKKSEQPAWMQTGGTTDKDLRETIERHYHQLGYSPVSKLETIANHCEDRFVRFTRHTLRYLLYHGCTDKIDPIFSKSNIDARDRRWVPNTRNLVTNAISEKIADEMCGLLTDYQTIDLDVHEEGMSVLQHLIQAMQERTQIYQAYETTRAQAIQAGRMTRIPPALPPPPNIAPITDKFPVYRLQPFRR